MPATCAASKEYFALVGTRQSGGIGYIVLPDKLAGNEDAIHVERDGRIEAAGVQRRLHQLQIRYC